MKTLPWPFTAVVEVPDIDGLSIGDPAAPFTPPISQRFGVPSVTGIIHKGEDEVITLGTPVRAPLDAIVFYAYPWGRDMPGLESDGSPGGYGSQVILMHARHGVLYSMHAHLSRVYVERGDLVARGQPVGLSGTTGISTGPHLHWEMRLSDNVTRFDPRPYVNRIIEEEDQLAGRYSEEELQLLDRLIKEPSDGLPLAKALIPLGIAMEDAGFTTAADPGQPTSDFAKALRQWTRLGKKILGPVMASPVKTVDKLHKDLAEP